MDPSRDYGFVAVAAGEGLKSVFTDLAADAVVSGGQTMNPSTEDILAAMQSVPAKTVFVLPNNKNIIMAAEQAEKLADRQVVVLPTRTIPQGITAMLNFDPSVNAETNTINMMAAADKVSTGLITYAARDSEYDGKRIKKGEIMALENGKIVSTSTDITKATYRLARGMCKKDSSFVTIISGCDVSDEDAEKVTEMVKAKCPNHVEVSHIRGGQPVYYYMISVGKQFLRLTCSLKNSNSPAVSKCPPQGEFFVVFRRSSPGCSPAGRPGRPPDADGPGCPDRRRRPAAALPPRGTLRRGWSPAPARRQQHRPDPSEN